MSKREKTGDVRISGVDKDRWEKLKKVAKKNNRKIPQQAKHYLEQAIDNEKETEEEN